MSAIHTWACFLLWISFATQDKTPDVTVTCFVSEECVLPCNFQPGSKISNGNATMILRRSGLKDRGTYRCHVLTSEGEHDAKVILKVEAPIRGLFLEQSRMSGYEEMKCTVRNVFPAPRVTWATEPPTFEDLRPVTRMLADKKGLYTVDSRLKRLKGQPDLIYICKVTTSYGGPAWTASLREREIRGTQGKDLTIPCSAPTYLNNPSLQWTFSNGEDFSRILTYDSRSGRSVSMPPWDNHMELDNFRVPFGDGALRLMDPKHLEHTGSYTCEFSVPYSSHTERNEVTIHDPEGEQRASEDASYWWVIGLVAAVLVLALAGMLAYLKLRGRTSKPRNDPEEVTELNLVKDAAAGQ
ncbi:HERV-H LTR-associating protein 2 isoform X2 [Leuresthes tenuis]|uniref:HERV-H LTR-associating protein 2 isoform X2 n=1 Tax=Leuresthes tenuis TaxID=355514 RepID=UPI003B50C590